MTVGSAKTESTRPAARYSSTSSIVLVVPGEHGDPLPRQIFAEIRGAIAPQRRAGGQPQGEGARDDKPTAAGPEGRQDPERERYHDRRMVDLPVVLGELAPAAQQRQRYPAEEQPNHEILQPATAAGRLDARR